MAFQHSAFSVQGFEAARLLAARRPRSLLGRAARGCALLSRDRPPAAWALPDLLGTARRRANTWAAEQRTALVRRSDGPILRAWPARAWRTRHTRGAASR